MHKKYFAFDGIIFSSPVIKATFIDAQAIADQQKAEAEAKAQAEAELREMITDAEELTEAHEQALVDIAEADRIRSRLQEEPLARALLDDDGAMVRSGRKPENIPGLRVFKSVLKIAPSRCHLPLLRPGRSECRGENAAGCEKRSRRQKREDASHDQAPRGSTNIRPRISMCRAWQNHWQ